MKLTLISDGTYQGCKNSTCPALYHTESGTYVVQGRKILPTDCEGVVGLGPREELVEVPPAILRLLVEQAKK